MPFRRPKRWNLAEKRWTSYGVLSIKPFPIERLHQFVRTCILAEKIKPSTETEIFKKNAISKTETTKFGEKMMNLLWSLGCWPISTSKASQICTNLNSDAKRKKCTEMKIFKKLPLPRLKWWNLAEKWWTSYRVQSVDPFPIEKLHQFERIGILAKKKRALKQKFLKNTMSQAETTQVCQKNDDSTKESFPLTYF